MAAVTRSRPLAPLTVRVVVVGIMTPPWLRGGHRKERAKWGDALAPPLQGRGWGGGCPHPGAMTGPTPNPSPEGEGLSGGADVGVSEPACDRSSSARIPAAQPWR